MDLLLFHPIYQDRVWGGQNLAHDLGRTLPHSGPIGESWEIVDRPEAQSVEVTSGLDLQSLLAERGQDIMGPQWMKAPHRRFPILVKWLDCQDRLSLQVHPPAAVAPQLGGEPKTECWYIAQATPEAGLYVGLKSGVSRSQFEQVLTESGGEGLEPLIHRSEVTSGESILLTSGRLHAIDAGNLILEIQQNSDTTYRVYDWDRMGLDGQPRQLHVEASLQSIDFDDFEPPITPVWSEPGERVLAECAHFRIRQLNLESGEHFALEAGIEPRILSVVKGQLMAQGRDQASAQTLAMASNALCPYVWGGVLEASGETTVLVTDQLAS